MNKFEKFLAVMILVLITSTVLAQVYKAGRNKGYAQGWSDANCGPENQCERGQE